MELLTVKINIHGQKSVIQELVNTVSHGNAKKLYCGPLRYANVIGSALNVVIHVQIIIVNVQNKTINVQI